MRDVPLILADLNLDEMRGYVFVAIRVVAGVVAAGLAWFLASPFFRILYRMFSPRKGIPGALLIPLRLASALTLGAAVFWFLPLGGGSGWGGFGSGMGAGDNKGKGKGEGSENPSNGDVKSTNPDPKNNVKSVGSSKDRTAIEIEIVPGKDAKKFYLLKKEGQVPGTFDDIKKLVIENKDKWQVHITFNRDGDTPTSDSAVYRRLEKLLDDNDVPHSKGKE